MNKAKYQYVFLQTDSIYQKCLGGNEEIPGYTMDMTHPCNIYQTDFEKASEGWKRLVIKSEPYAHSGKFTGYLDSTFQYSATLEIKPENISPCPALFYIEGSVWIHDSIKGSSNTAMIVISIDSIDQAGNYWYGFPVNDVPDNTVGVWRNCRFSLTLPEFRHPGRTLKIYIWDWGKKPFMIDDFSVAFYTEKKKIQRD